jgi:RNA polymerase sigma-70 factor (ECF subfamily)
MAEHQLPKLTVRVRFSSPARFEGRSSVRWWLYKIATTTCLNALKARKRRPLPSGLGAPSRDGGVGPGVVDSTIEWIQPAPDSLLSAMNADPAEIVSGRDGVRLAFVAALQHLSARQRAVLILRDVLGWTAKEVAEMLETSNVAVNSALIRARAQLAQAGPVLDELAEPPERATRSLLDRYVAAFENADVNGLAQLLRADVELEMPPFPAWFTGQSAVCEFLARVVLDTPDRWRLIPTRANGCPAFAMYARTEDGVFRAQGVDVLSLVDGQIGGIVAFNDPSLVATFGFPAIFTPPGTPISDEVGNERECE